MFQHAMAKIFKINDQSIVKATEILRQGGLVSFPTETVYGLGANACDDNAVANIFETKGRPNFNPLIIHVADLHMAMQYGKFNHMARMIAQKLWPAALTLVVPLKANNKLSKLVTAGLETIAIRIPAHDAAIKLLRQCAMPIAAPSANISGKLSPTNAKHVNNSLGDKIDIILDGGDCKIGLESTIIDCSSDNISLLRHGGVTITEIENIIKKPILIPNNNDDIDEISPKSPGQLKSHYAPMAKIRLNVKKPLDGEKYLGFGNCCPDAILNLSPDSDLKQAAANLFNMLHDLDIMPNSDMINDKDNIIAIAPIPNNGIGIAINDRLSRAAAPRP